jgi:hypothetical protein
VPLVKRFLGAPDKNIAADDDDSAKGDKGERYGKAPASGTVGRGIAPRCPAPSLRSHWRTVQHGTAHGIVALGLFY